jgi:hypothetical protein
MSGWRLKNLLRRKLEKNFRKKAFLKLNELPQFNWFMFQDTGDLSYVLKNKSDYKNSMESFAITVWQELSDEYINNFGFSEEYIKILDKKKEIAQLQLDYVANDDPTRLTFIEVAEEELKKMNESESENMYDVVAFVSKKTGILIDIKRISVMEFKAFCKLAQETDERE